MVKEQEEAGGKRGYTEKCGVVMSNPGGIQSSGKNRVSLPPPHAKDLKTHRLIKETYAVRTEVHKMEIEHC